MLGILYGALLFSILLSLIESTSHRSSRKQAVFGPTQVKHNLISLVSHFSPLRRLGL